MLLPNECISNILFFLDDRSLYKCLFVNRYWCRLSVPILWRDPFNYNYWNRKSNAKFSLVINTLLTCLNEDEISSLIPCTIKFNNQTPLFEYEKFVRIIDHEYCVRNIINWLESSASTEVFDVNQDFRVQKLVNVIYRMIMRGSKLREFILRISRDDFYIDLPNFSIFNLELITNLRSMFIDLEPRVDMKYQNTIEFLSMVSKFCNGIVNCDMYISESSGAFSKLILDIIRLQPLERMLIYFDIVEENARKILHSLGFRSKTLKELSFDSLDFQDINLSFMTELECLERLKFEYCKGFTSKHYEALFKKKFHLKELKLWVNINDTGLNEIKINSLCNESLLKLSLNIITPETVKAVKESCPNISFLHTKIYQEQPLDSIIPLICELSSLKILHIQVNYYGVDKALLVKTLGDYLTFVEYLLLDFRIDLPSFKYFTNNCKANLKTWNILVNEYFRKDYLRYVDDFQRVHNSLRVLGINYIDGFNWIDEELEIIDSLKNQGVDVVSSKELDNLFYM